MENWQLGFCGQNRLHHWLAGGWMLFPRVGGAGMDSLFRASVGSHLETGLRIPQGGSEPAQCPVWVAGPASLPLLACPASCFLQYPAPEHFGTIISRFLPWLGALGLPPAAVSCPPRHAHCHLPGELAGSSSSVSPLPSGPVAVPWAQ